MEASIGHNMPPEPSPFEAAKARLDDLRIEAGNWLDGSAITTPAEADEVSALLDMIRKGTAALEAARKAEVRPLDDAKKAIQERYKGVSVGADLMLAECRKVLGAWLKSVEDRQRKEAEAARIEADRIRAEAEAAIKAAKGLDDLEAASQSIADVKQAEKVATRLEGRKAKAEGGERAIGLKTVKRVEIVNENEAVRYCWINHRQALMVEATRIITADVRSGVAQIPGVIIHTERVL